MRQKGALGWLKHDVTHRGVTAWILTGLLAAFYLLLYFGGRTVAGVAIPDVWTWVADSMGLPHKWTFYGLVYTVAIAVGGVYVMYKYSHDRYQLVRTSVVIFVQCTLAFAIPWILHAFEQPEYYFSYLWPLEIGDFYPSKVLERPMTMVVYGFFAPVVLVPLLGVLYGKRWYCSWVCGCGGLANTAGEPFRHLSSKTSRSWKFEKWSVHLTLVLALVVTAGVIAAAAVGNHHPQFEQTAASLQSFYGFAFITVLSGIVGVVAYPIGGTRVWCRFFCPMAALLGLIQKFGRFQISVKDDMCISCGMCTKYCEMGIDVRAYAQANENFTRAACVGCGICSEVCPRGVLKLENKTSTAPTELSISSLLSESYR